LEQAREMLRLSEEAKKEGKGVAVMNGKFIGPPMVLAARKTIEKNEMVITRSKALGRDKASYHE
jgi:citrate lyase subunit beta/citryl-CoA lyase